jgi:hypothetical protein
MERPLTTKEVEEMAAANAAKAGGGERISVADIEAAIAGTFYQSGDALMGHGSMAAGVSYDDLRHDATFTTLCMIVMKNGFRVIGHSTPASPANFDFELGKKLAYDNAFRQLWPLMGFMLKTRQAEGW